MFFVESAYDALQTWSKARAIGDKHFFERNPNLPAPKPEDWLEARSILHPPTVFSGDAMRCDDTDYRVFTSKDSQVSQEDVTKLAQLLIYDTDSFDDFDSYKDARLGVSICWVVEEEAIAHVKALLSAGCAHTL